VLAVVFGIFTLALHIGKGEDEARALSFAAMVFANIMLILTNLSWKDNFIRIMKDAHPAFWWVASAALSVLVLTLYTPFFRSVFHFGRLHANDLLFTLGGGAVSLAWFELMKLFRKEKAASG
jgi:Ca2+-transporting ATPase